MPQTTAHFGASVGLRRATGSGAILFRVLEAYAETQGRRRTTAAMPSL